MSGVRFGLSQRDSGSDCLNNFRICPDHMDILPGSFGAGLSAIGRNHSVKKLNRSGPVSIEVVFEEPALLGFQL